ncbi:hypothetical protein [Symbioplanes lichenis]|uniref:hypothetical protein n=1 Tax=Symbioplanes lichenis TaxID=1629072 RepID=UPI00273A3977|nr:hypothetical protein [Actinoplanes lichenis]
MREPWWERVHEAAQLLASQVNAAVARAARDGVYSPPPGAPAPRRRRRPASLRHLAEVIRAHRLAPGMSVDKDDVAAVLAGDPRAVSDPVLVLGVARAAHLIAGVPLGNAEADRLVVAAAHVAALTETAREADGRAATLVPELVPVAHHPAEPVIIDASFTTRRPGRRRALVAAVLGLLVLAGSAALTASRGTREPEPEEKPAPPAVTAATPLDHADSRDDYLNPRPLQDALDHGFTGIDVDVVLRDGGLLLCHHVDGDACADPGGNPITARPFDATYLRALSSRVSATGGRVYPGFHQPVMLFVEITCGTDAGGCALPADRAAAAASPDNPLVVAQAVIDALVPYRSMLFHVGAAVRHWGPVQVVLSGDHTGEQYPTAGGGSDSVRGLIERQSDRYAFLDGSLGIDRDQPNADLVPVITFPNPDPGCTRHGTEPIQHQHWDHIIAAQSTGHHVRVWDPDDCPERGDFWTDALYGGVDYLSSSHVTLLGDWLTTTAAGGGGGRCEVPGPIGAERFVGQYCTLATGDVPVMTGPDPNSARAGTLAKGGSTWFLGQQPGQPYSFQGRHNFWWAYTRADNGKWGWVSLVHFADGVLDQPADGLQYSCYDVRPGESDDCHPL